MSSDFQPIVPSGFDALIGTEITKIEPDLATARVEIRPELLQPFGLLHGGVYASIAESLASWATAVNVGFENHQSSGLSNQTSFLRPATSGTLLATATRKHSGRTTWVWEVEFTDDEGRLCALSRMTIAVREISR